MDNWVNSYSEQSCGPFLQLGFFSLDQAKKKVGTSRGKKKEKKKKKKEQAIYINNSCVYELKMEILSMVKKIPEELPLRQITSLSKSTIMKSLQFTTSQKYCSGETKSWK